MSILLSLEPYLIPGAISAAGIMIWGSINDFRTTINDRLEELEKKMDAAIREITAVVIRQQVDQVEIEKLREKVHSLSSDVIGLETVQERCATCNPHRI